MQALVLSASALSLQAFSSAYVPLPPPLLALALVLLALVLLALVLLALVLLALVLLALVLPSAAPHWCCCCCRLCRRFFRY